MISTTKETARELRQLIRSADAFDGIGAGIGCTITRPVIVKVVNAISAGDYTPKAARLMKISGGALVATGQTILVRHVGTGAVPANTVVLTEPCGKLGQCFARNTSPATPLQYTVERYFRLVGPLPNETGFENKTWSTTAPGQRSGGFYSLHCVWDPAATPTSTDPGTGRRLFAQRMSGVRFEIHGYPTTWTQGLQTQFSNITNLMVGRSSVLPPATSHLLMNLQQIDLPHTGFNHYWYSQGGSGLDTTDVETTHYRVWIDGVDMTGIVSLGSPFPHNYAAGTIGGITNRRIGGWITSTVAAAAYQSKTVWFDIWVTVNTYNRAWYWGGDPALADSYEPACGVESTGGFNTAKFRSANVNANRYAGDQYRVSFADNGPGSLSSLDIAAGGGWTLTNSAASFKLTNDSIGEVELNWNFESPVLTLTDHAKHNSPTGALGVVRYMPAASGDYTYRNQNGSSISFGVWNPQGSTIFQPVSRRINNVFVVKGSANAPASMFANFPSTITVEKI